MRQVFALAEAYPDLKAGESFLALQRSLTEIEDHIQNARRYYNAVVRDLNTKIAQFPSNLIAGPFGIRPREFFGLATPPRQRCPASSSAASREADLAGRARACWRSPPRRRRSARSRSSSSRRTSSVNADGSVDVTETITAQFSGKWNGIYRTVPVDYRTPQGFNWSLRLERTSATTDGRGAAQAREQPRAATTRSSRSGCPAPRTPRAPCVLRYRAANGLRFFEDHDELYWNITGDEWDMPIEAASAQITLPAGAAGVRAIAFNGAYGSTARDAEVEASMAAPCASACRSALGFHEGVTAVVGWDTGW